jgi:hypothetical protein
MDVGKETDVHGHANNMLDNDNVDMDLNDEGPLPPILFRASSSLEENPPFIDMNDDTAFFGDGDVSATDI